MYHKPGGQPRAAVLIERREEAGRWLGKAIWMVMYIYIYRVNHNFLRKSFH